LDFLGYTAMNAGLPKRLPAEADQVLILTNPKAGAGPARERLEKFLAALTRWRLRGHLVADRTEIGPRADELQRAGRLRAVVSAGGDGTAAETINRTAPGIPIALFALGTENLMARYLKMPRQPDDLAEIIAAGTLIHHDAGNASGRLFAIMIGCGFDAEVVRRVHLERDGHITRANYLKPIWESIRSYEYPQMRISYELTSPTDEPLGNTGTTANGNGSPAGNWTTIDARFAFIVNIPRFALGLRFVAEAQADDGHLDLCTFRGGSFFHGLWYLGNLLVQNHRQLPDCTVRRVRRLRIESDRPVPYELDGDASGFLPLDVQIEANRLTLIVPPSWPARNCRSLDPNAA
jgi:diacylglycerol kinase family enzyme